MGRLSTHVLDTVAGRPAAGVRIDLSRLEGGNWRLIKTVTTNADGRTDEPLLVGNALASGRYELNFHIGAHFAKRDLGQSDPPFLDEVPLRFTVADADSHYHVPLVATPWSYSTYRGS